MPSVDGLLHELATSPETVFLLASLDDVAVGTGVGKTSSVGDAYYSMVRVLPAHRGVGVGTAVLSALSDHARRAGRGSLIGRLREDDDDGSPVCRAAGDSACSRASARSRSTSRAFEEPARDLPVGRRDREPRRAPRPGRGRLRGSLDRAPRRARRLRGTDGPPVRRVGRGNDRRLRGALPDLSLVALVDGELSAGPGLRRSPVTRRQRRTSSRACYPKRGAAGSRRR